MNENIKALWTTALRSGDYRQGRGALSVNGKYCCLGVLCDIAVKEGAAPEPTENSIGEKEYGPVGFRNSVILPNSVAAWAGLPNNAGRFDGALVNEYDTLWQLNDAAEMSFGEIADVIDEKF